MWRGARLKFARESPQMKEGPRRCLEPSSLRHRELLAVRHGVRHEIQRARLAIDLQDDVALRVVWEVHLDRTNEVFGFGLGVTRHDDVYGVQPHDRSRNWEGIQVARQIPRHRV